MVIKEYLIRQNHLTIKKAIDNFDFIKIKNLSSLKKITLRKGKTQNGDLKNAYNKELIPKYVKSSCKSIIKTEKLTFKKIGEILDQIFH